MANSVWTLDRLLTPALVVDLDRTEENLARTAAEARRAGLQVWPHTKTHKTPLWARMQLDLGAKGLTVAKLGEAQVMAQAGLGPIQIFYPLLGEASSRRLSDLLRIAHGPVRVVLDSEASLDTVAVGARMADVGVEVLIEVDTGLHRAGVATPEEALTLGRAIGRRDGVRFAGLASFAGHVGYQASEEARLAVLREEGRILSETRECLEGAGIPVEAVSVGGTHHAARMAQITGATEIRPGTYIYQDRATVLAGSATWETCSATVLSTVVSTHRDWVVVDAGSKALASDTVSAGGCGAVLGHPEWEITGQSEEHGILRLAEGTAGAGARLPTLGDRLRIVPNHICTVVNLFDAFYGVRSDAVVLRTVIAGRGRSQ